MAKRISVDAVHGLIEAEIERWKDVDTFSFGSPTDRHGLVRALCNVVDDAAESSGLGVAEKRLLKQIAEGKVHRASYETYKAVEAKGLAEYTDGAWRLTSAGSALVSV